MKLLTVIMGMCGWSLCVKAQSAISRGSNINPDLIFFSDNLPTIETKSGTEKTMVEVQKSVEPPEQDSYSQAALANQNQFGPFAVVPLPQNTNSLRAPAPNVNLRPPVYDPSNQNYFTGFNENINNVRSGVTAAAANTNTTRREFSVNNITIALSTFGLNVLRNINRRGGNSVVSPFSIAELLSLLQQGSLGLTQQEISEALQMAPPTSIAAFLKANEIIKQSQSSNSHNILRVANNVFVSDSFDLSPAFMNMAMRVYDSEITPMQFQSSQESVKKINTWVAQKTNNKITDLLSEDAVGENTQVVLVNAVYFKGLWAVRFRPESTLPRDFYANGAMKKKIPFMRIRKAFRTGTDPTNGAQVISIPFENEQYSLMVVLPAAVSSLDALVSKLTGLQLAGYNSFPLKEVDLEIPKFSIKADTDLNPVLRKMGIMNLFGPRSELSGLGTFRGYSPQVSSALHTAMLSIDEDGGTASAATSFAVVALSYDDAAISYKANRPFLTVLWDNESALPLFMARIYDI